MISKKQMETAFWECLPWDSNITCNVTFLAYHLLLLHDWGDPDSVTVSQFICSFIHLFTQQALADHLPTALGRCWGYIVTRVCPCPQVVDSLTRVVLSSEAKGPCRALATVPWRKVEREHRVSPKGWGTRCS